jgi:Amt family ammonium transporter
MMIDRKILLLAASVAMLAAAPVVAQDQPTAALAYYSIDNIILLLCAVLVLFMQAGFAALESGLSPVNNTVNIMFKYLNRMCHTGIESLKF